ncbi:AAA family ATPase [Chondromyces crocatus]|uniref:ATPase AAA-type core domain-containing protein n=1 Tax=Chondromyces crocatus TaxID=52 RepID=A0A0K1EGV7_CHOCO|nr:AAA family ATPase [Chondromyces crocatus]AKT40090.1 uncharacterized protein CMC5_042430 [Chondromyces crocatus]
MLTTLEIRGFKAIRETNIIVLGPLTSLFGHRDSGQNAVIEALQWLQDAIVHGLHGATLRQGTTFEGLLHDGARRVAFVMTLGSEEEGETSYALEVATDDAGVPVVRHESCREGSDSVTALLTIHSRQVAGKSCVRGIEGASPLRDPDTLALSFVKKARAPGAERLRDLLQDAVFLRPSYMALGFRERVQPGAGAPVLDDPRRRDEEGRAVVALLRRLTPEVRALVVTEIAQLFPGERGNGALAVGAGDGETLARHEGGTSPQGEAEALQVPSWLLSEGMRWVTALFALLVVRPRPRLIVVQEIERGLDAGALNGVLRALRQASREGIQVLLSSHSPSLLDQMTPEEVIHVQCEEGETVFESVDGLEEVLLR